MLLSSVISMLLLEHSSPVVLQLLNAVLNVSKGTVSTLLPANSIAQCDKQTMKNEDAVSYFGACSYLSGYQRLANSFTVLTLSIMMLHK